MSILILLVLCVVQGLTEFLPVSSSGHLLFFEQILGINDNRLFLNLFLHLATLLAVVIYYRKVIAKLIKKPFQDYTKKLIISTTVTVIFAIIYECAGLDNFATKFYCFGFLATSILLFVCDRFQKKAAIVSCENITKKNAIVVGAVQGIAVIPGLSRSGSTISSLIFLGKDEKTASEYSFLLSIPIIIGGFVFELLKTSKSGFVFDFANFKLYFAMFVITFLVSLLSLKLTIKLLKKQKFIIFSVYTFLMFIVTFILNFMI